MNKLAVTLIFPALLFIAVSAQAQTSDETSASEAAPVEVPAPVVTPPSIPSVSVSQEPLLTKALREGTALHVRQEQAFDVNANNHLEPDEVRAFLKSVKDESARGPVKNTSDLLYNADKNKDGYIDRSEASSLPI